MEEWRDVVGYEGMYQVSNQGRVRSVDRKVEHSTAGILNIPGKTLSPFSGGNGYHKVSLCRECVRRKRPIHRLVAEAFLPNPNNLPTVNHKDGNKMNNSVENLEWVTFSENASHAVRTGLNDIRPSHEACIKKTSKTVLMLKDGVVVGEFPSANEAARAVGGSQGLISRVCGKSHRTAYGYEWRYK